jgi:hypothetical protein
VVLVVNRPKKIGDPRGGWWVGGSEAQKKRKKRTRVEGWVYIFLIFFMVFLNSPQPRNTQKRDKKIKQK